MELLVLREKKNRMSKHLKFDVMPVDFYKGGEEDERTVKSGQGRRGSGRSAGKKCTETVRPQQLLSGAFYKHPESLTAAWNLHAALGREFEASHLQNTLARLSCRHEITFIHPKKKKSSAMMFPHLSTAT